MKECEFKKECNALYPEEWKNCSPRIQKECVLRKFAILVWNKAIEDFELHLRSHHPYMTGHLTQANVMEIAKALRETSQ